MNFDELYAKMGEIMDTKEDLTTIPPCKYNYHDDDHEDLCTFECTLDSLLKPDTQLTEKAQAYRDELITGVERMMDKVNYYRRMYK